MRSHPIIQAADRWRRPEDRLPHPSWRQALAGADRGAGRITSARDFWARLGL